MTTRQLLECAEYHEIVGKPGVDHADVPLALLASSVMNFLRGEDADRIGTSDLMPHLKDGSELDVDAIYESFQEWKKANK